MKISFCTTCKNRVYQLQQTIFKNIQEIRQDGNSELILLNYNDNELDKFIEINFKEEIANKTLLYLKEEESVFFEVSKAKNLAHFAASGDFLFNLDADNFINNEFDAYRALWKRTENIVIHGDRKKQNDGSFGRIGLSKKIFNYLGGYDEDIGSYYEDVDLIKRCMELKLYYASVTDEKTVSIKNSIQETIKYTKYKNYTQNECYLENKKISVDKLDRNEIQRNLNRKKIKLQKNFNEYIYI